MAQLLEVFLQDNNPRFVNVKAAILGSLGRFRVLAFRVAVELQGGEIGIVARVVGLRPGIGCCKHDVLSISRLELRGLPQPNVLSRGSSGLVNRRRVYDGLTGLVVALDLALIPLHLGRLSGPVEA